MGGKVASGQWPVVRRGRLWAKWYAVLGDRLVLCCGLPLPDFEPGAGADGLVGEGAGAFLDAFGDAGVGVDEVEEVGVGDAVADHEGGGLDGGAGVGAECSHAKEAVGLGIDEDLDEALGALHGDGAWDGAVVDAGGAVGDAFLAGFGFVHADGCDFGMEEHDGGNVVVAEGAGGDAEEFLDGIAAFQFGDVDEGDVGGEVTYGTDVGDGGASVFVTVKYVAAVGDLDAEFVEAEAGGVGSAAHCDEGFFDLVNLLVVAVVEGVFYVAIHNVHLVEAGPFVDMDTLGGEVGLDEVGHVFIFKGQDAVGFVDEENLGAPKEGKDGGKFTADDTCAQDDDAFGVVLEVGDAVAGEDGLFVDGDVGELAGDAACGEDAVVGLEVCWARGGMDDDLGGGKELGVAVHKVQMAASGVLVSCFDGGLPLCSGGLNGLAGLGCDVLEGDLAGGKVEASGVVVGVCVGLGDFPQDFAAECSVVEACATDLVLFDEEDTFAEVEASHGCCKTSGASTDHTEVVMLHGGKIVKFLVFEGVVSSQ